MASLRHLACVATLCLTFSSTFGNIILGIGVEDSDNNQLLEEFTCPGIGNYAVRQTGNCAKFFDCRETHKKPAAIKQCSEPAHNQFNRLSRTCIKTEYVNCRWCRKLGRHADRTSSRHFIVCAPGIVAIRYRCKTGKYDSARRRCAFTRGRHFSVEEDAVEDGPEEIVEFMKDWKRIEEMDEDRFKLEQERNEYYSSEKLRSKRSTAGQGSSQGQGQGGRGLAGQSQGQGAGQSQGGRSLSGQSSGQGSGQSQGGRSLAGQSSGQGSGQSQGGRSLSGQSSGQGSGQSQGGRSLSGQSSGQGSGQSQGGRSLSGQSSGQGSGQSQGGRSLSGQSSGQGSGQSQGGRSLSGQSKGQGGRSLSGQSKGQGSGQSQGGRGVSGQGKGKGDGQGGRGVFFIGYDPFHRTSTTTEPPRRSHHKKKVVRKERKHFVKSIEESDSSEEKANQWKRKKVAPVKSEEISDEELERRSAKEGKRSRDKARRRSGEDTDERLD